MSISWKNKVPACLQENVVSGEAQKLIICYVILSLCHHLASREKGAVIHEIFKNQCFTTN